MVNRKEFNSREGERFHGKCVTIHQWSFSRGDLFGAHSVRFEEGLDVGALVKHLRVSMGADFVICRSAARASHRL